MVISKWDAIIKVDFFSPYAGIFYTKLWEKNEQFFDHHFENCTFGLDYPSLKMTQTINFYSSINMFLLFSTGLFQGLQNIDSINYGSYLTSEYLECFNHLLFSISVLGKPLSTSW